MSARSLEQYILAESPWFDEIYHKASSCQRRQEILRLCQFLLSSRPPKVYTDWLLSTMSDLSVVPPERAVVHHTGATHLLVTSRHSVIIQLIVHTNADRNLVFRYCVPLGLPPDQVIRNLKTWHLATRHRYTIGMAPGKWTRFFLKSEPWIVSFSTVS